MKLNKTYTLAVQTGTGTATFSFPLSIGFNIKRDVLSSMNTGNFRIYNLAAETRRSMQKDEIDIDVYRQIIFQAGYEGDPKIPIIFQGNIISCYSYKQGVDWITEINAWDGGFGVTNGTVSITKNQPYNITDALKNLISTMPNVTIGAIGTFTQTNARALTMIGSSWSTFKSTATSDYYVFIDQEKVYAMKKNEEFLGFQGVISEISSDTGLIGSPRRGQARLDVVMIFEPRVAMGQIVTLNALEKEFNGNLQVLGISHTGMISGSMDQRTETRLSLNYVPKLLNMRQIN